MKFLTAGESHGKGLVGILEGVPSGLCLSEEKIAEELNRRRKFYGRSNRMKLECDIVEFYSGTRQGITSGAPISFVIKNNDYRPEMFQSARQADSITKPRAGHADYAGMLKYGLMDARMIAERASGRETLTRTVIGAIARQILSEISVSVCSHVTGIGGIKSTVLYYSDNIEANRDSRNDILGGLSFEKNSFEYGDKNRLADKSSVRCLDQKAEQDMINLIDKHAAEGDTLGGEIELILRGLPIGFGSFVHYEKRLDYKISAMLMSIPSVKGVYIGNTKICYMTGNDAADPIAIKDTQIIRTCNNGGGIEGGISNGQDIVVKLLIKPVPTTKKGVQTIDVVSREQSVSHYERSDICVVPAISVVAENLLAYVIADTVISELGGDTMFELTQRFLQKKELQHELGKNRK